MSGVSHKGSPRNSIVFIIFLHLTTLLYIFHADQIAIAKILTFTMANLRLMD